MNVGDIFLMNDGEIEIIDFSGWKNVKIRFLRSGYEATVSTTHIKNKNVRDRFKPLILGIGYIGGVKYKSRISGKVSTAYNCWKAMLYRCYGEISINSYPTYIGCSVDKSWHNFQNFAEWYEDNYPKSKSKNGNRYELDKDIKFSGNKIYGPKTCIFVDHDENVRAATNKKYKIKNPSGETIEIFGMRDFCIKNNLDPSSMTKVSKGILKYHKGWTPPALI